MVRHSRGGARDETIVPGCTRGEGKGASGLSERSPFTRWERGGLGRTGLDPRSLRVTRGPTPTDIMLCRGPVLRAPTHIVWRARGSATKRQRYAGGGARERNVPCRHAGPPKRASRRETEGSHIAWDAVRSVPRQRGCPFFGNEIVGSRRRSKCDRGHRRIRSHADAEAPSRAAAPSLEMGCRVT